MKKARLKESGFAAIITACCSLILLVFLNCDTGTGSDRDFQVMITSGDLNRSFLIHLPTSYESLNNIPVVVVFHGAISSGASIRNISGFDNIADSRGFIMVYPDAAHANWAEGIGAQADTMGIDDVGFFNDIIDELDNDYDINRERIYAVGFSQGGLFTHRLAVDNYENLTAYATVSSTMSVPISLRNYDPTELPVIMVQGTADYIFRWGGDRTIGIFSYLSQQEVLRKMLFNNPAVSDSLSVEIPDTVNDGIHIIRKTYMDSGGRNIVEFFIVGNGTHTWYNGDIITSEVIMEFFDNLE